MQSHGAFLGRVQISPLYRLGSTQAMTDADGGLIETVQAAVVKFFSEGCPPCGEYKPIFNEVADRTPADIMMAEVDIDLAPGLASKYDIKATPTTIFLATGKELNRVEGKMTPDGLEAMMLSAFGEGLLVAKEQEAQHPEGPRLIKPGPTEVPIRSLPGSAPRAPVGYEPAAAPSAKTAAPSKTLLVAGGIGIVGIVTGALLLAKG